MKGVTLSNLPMPVEEDEERRKKEMFLRDVHEFTENVRTGTCEPVNLVHKIVFTPDQKKEVDAELGRQAVTFEADVKKMLEGKMSYSEMRSLYG